MPHVVQQAEGGEQGDAVMIASHALARVPMAKQTFSPELGAATSPCQTHQEPGSSRCVLLDASVNSSASWTSFLSCPIFFCAAPRAQHLLRALPPSQSATYAEAHDQAITATLFGERGSKRLTCWPMHPSGRCRRQPR